MLSFSLTNPGGSLGEGPPSPPSDAAASTVGGATATCVSLSLPRSENPKPHTSPQIQPGRGARLRSGVRAPPHRCRPTAAKNSPMQSSSPRLIQKNSFEWGLQGIPHSEDAVQVTQHIANFLVREARMSSNRPSSKEVLDNLIYNYTPTYCGKSGRGFDEVYIFSKAGRHFT